MKNGGWEYIAVLTSALLVQAGLGNGRMAITAPSHAGRSNAATG